MLRVIHLNPTKYWRGGEQQTLYLAKYLKKHKVKQWVVGNPNSLLEVQCKQNQISYKPIRIFGEIDFLAAYHLAKFIRENQIQVIHCHTAKAHSIGLLAKKILKAQKYSLLLIVSRRVDFSLKKSKIPFVNFFSNSKYFSKDVDHYIAISENVKKILMIDGIPEDKISVIYSGVDLDRFKKKIPSDNIKELKKEFKIEQHFVFGNIAALVDHKDHKTLLKALFLLNQEKNLPPWKCIVVGDGPLYQELLSLKERFQLEDKVYFTGFRKDAFEFFSIFDVFVMSSKEEGLGTSLLDAMAYGLPIVATKGGGIPEIVQHDQGGLLSSIQEPEELKNNLLEILKNKKLKKRFSEYNLKFVKKFSYQNTGKQTLKLYYRLLNSYTIEHEHNQSLSIQ
ncbi:MAG: glycosyltransferase family 4 protein [Leptonema sp. (in: bacteria)]